MANKTVKKKAKRNLVSRAKVTAALDEVVQWYQGYEMSNTTWKFWVKTVTDYLNGKMSTKQFVNVDVPEPDDEEEITWRHGR